MTPAATASANTNIALIKYWGKADESLTIPNNIHRQRKIIQAISTATSKPFVKKSMNAK